MKNYILYTTCVLLAITIANKTQAQQPSRDLSRFTGKGPLAPSTGSTFTKNATAVRAQPSRDLNRFAGKAPLAPGTGNTVAKTTHTAAKKAATVSVNLPSASPATEKKQATKTTLPVSPPAAITDQENAKPAATPKAKTVAKPAPVKS